MQASIENAPLLSPSTNVTATVYLPKSKVVRDFDSVANFLEVLGREFVGYTFRFEVVGGRSDQKTNTFYCDTCLAIDVVMRSQVASFFRLNDLVAEIAEVLEEIAIFVRISKGSFYFVYPKLGPGRWSSMNAAA